MSRGLAYSPQEARDTLDALEMFFASASARHTHGDHVCMAVQPGSVHGSPDDLVAEGVPRAAAITGLWIDQIFGALASVDNETQMAGTLSAAGADISVDALGELLFEEMMRALELGGLDSQWEREHETDIAPAMFRDDQPVSRMPRERAIELWEERKVLPPEQYAVLSDALKRRAFSFAGAAKEDILNVAHAELGKRLKDGTIDVRELRSALGERLESAGWTPASPTHLETIVRTNVVSANAAGRHADQTQPDVMAALPYWEMRGVPDARQRKTHRAATNPPGLSHGTILPANHPFWQRAYPPWGFNCRCRVIARTQRWMDRNNAVVGPVPSNLPDSGFSGGGRAFVSVPAPVARSQKPAAIQDEAPERSGSLEPTIKPSAPAVSLPPVPPSARRIAEESKARRGKRRLPPPKIKPSETGLPQAVRREPSAARGPQGEPSWIPTDNGFRGFGFLIQDVILRRTPGKRWELVLDGEVHKLPKKPSFDEAERIIKKATKNRLPENFASARALEEKKARAAAGREARKRKP